MGLYEFMSIEFVDEECRLNSVSGFTVTHPYHLCKNVTHFKAIADPDP